MDDLSVCFEPIRQVWREANWPGVEEGFSYGTPALKVRGKLIVRIREPGIIVFVCDLDEKEFLMMSAPDVYFETNHYKGWPAILAHLDVMDPEELRDRIEKTWRSLATKKMIAEYDQRARP
jgi:hypothetical protein